MMANVSPAATSCCCIRPTIRLSFGGSSKVAADAHDEAIPAAIKVPFKANRVVRCTSKAILRICVFMEYKSVELAQYNIQFLGLPSLSKFRLSLIKRLYNVLLPQSRYAIALSFECFLCITFSLSIQNRLPLRFQQIWLSILIKR